MKKYLYMLAAGVLAVSMLSGCSVDKSKNNEQAVEETTKTASEAGDVTFTDALGHSVTVNNPKTTIACMGSFAETWLLAGGELAGVTDDAYDENRTDIPDGISSVGTLNSPSAETIISMNPDFVILSANTKEHVELYDTLNSAGINTAYFSVNTFEDYLDMLNILTTITGREDLYEKNGIEVQNKINEVIESTKGKESPKVLYIRAFSTGAKAKDSTSMTGKMLADLGATNIADLQPSLLEDLSMEEIIKQDPDFIFVTTMGSSEEAAIEYLKTEVESNPVWNELSAVKNGRYIVLDKALFHYKPNARWGESYEVLANYLYGEE